MANVNEWSPEEDGNTTLDQFDLERQITPHSPLNRYTKKIMAAVRAKTDAMQAEIDTLAPTSGVVHIEGDETVSGVKTFTSPIVGDLAVTAAGAATQRTVSSRFADGLTPKDFGAVGDGETPDGEAFEDLEAAVTGRFVNLCGASYAVDSEPSGNLYYNGFFVVDGTTKEVSNSKIYIKNSELTGIGIRGDHYFISGDVPEHFDPSKHRIISIGTKAAKNVDLGKECVDIIAIGDGAMSEGHPGLYNTAIGLFALHNINSNGSTNGYRNTAIGSLSLFGVTTGSYNVGLGRDAGQPITTGTYNVCLGYGAMGGRVPMRLSGNIEVENPVTGSYNTCIGRAGFLLSGISEDNILIGYNALNNAKVFKRNCIIGRSAFGLLGIGQSINGKRLITVNDSGTYSQSGNTITVSISGHQAVSGRYVRINFTSGDIHRYYAHGDANILSVANVLDASTFTIESPISLTASGECTVTEYEQDVAFEDEIDNNVCVGYNAGGNALTGGFNVVLGSQAAKMNVETGSARAISNSTVVGGSCATNVGLIDGSEIIGFTAGRDPSKIEKSTIIGYAAGRAAKNLNDTVFIGRGTGNLGVNFSSCSAIGAYALMSRPEGLVGEDPVLTNCTALGYNAQVTGDNQVQLGGTGTHAYVWNAVQLRSDFRDKADIRDTQLGLDFLLSLRPVDFRWDCREAYSDVVEDGVDDEGNPVFKTVVHKKDGSRKRKRFHHGLIAQEIKSVLDEKGIDFGGYQDHKVNGGKDVLSLGYEEFIAPIIKSIQELNSRIAALEA